MGPPVKHLVRYTYTMHGCYKLYTPCTNTNTNRYSYSSASCSFARQVFVPWTNTLSNTWGKHSSHGRIPSPAHGASIRPMDEYPLQHMGQAFVNGRMPFPKHWASTRPQINPLQKHGASIRPPTRNVSETWGEYLLVIRIGQTIRILPRALPVDEYNRYI